MQKITGFALLTCTALFGLSPATGAWAADVNKLVENCANCHGKDGVSTESDVPIIAGYSAPYLSDSLAAYKKKERPCPETKYRSGDKKGQKTDMCHVAKDLSDADIKQMAQHFSGVKFVRAQQKFDPALAQKGKEIHERSCEKCHSEGGGLASDDSGILAGQWMPYLDEAFKEYSSGKRPMPKKMKPKMEKLEKADFDALVNYYGSFK
ncbi:MAG: c-type cytochrome [Gammaproteobacteria bacterium]|nr:c-type cytochrome [Gammaproteobacteria bacterium]